MPNTHSTLTSLFSDIADAIRGKTGSSATIVADDFPTAIASIPTGGSATIEPLSITANGTYTAPSGVDGYSPITVNVPNGNVAIMEESNSTGTTLYINSTDGVRFIDYDGTVLYSYSASEFANLTAMPANPTHTGLTSQGWNWSLADAKAQVAATGYCDIGQMYITDDGKTRIYISLNDSSRLAPYLGICPNGTVVVDWGDNTSVTLTGTSLTTVKRAQHPYASTGDYVITLTVTNGTFTIFGTTTNTNGSYLLTRTDTTVIAQRCYQNAIKKVELGSNVSIGNNAFYNCYSLATITIPSGITSMPTYAFYYCYSLLGLILPSGVTSISSNMCSYCHSLKFISIPKSVTSMGTSPFSYCYNLTRVVFPINLNGISTSTFYSCAALSTVIIPESVTVIGTYAFYGCHSLKSINLPSSLDSIGGQTFYYCYSLVSIIIPEGVTSIGNYAFANCYSLSSISLPSTLTSIGASAFYTCYTLTSITIPNGVTSIGNNAFEGCSSLDNLIIPNTVTSIGTYLVRNCPSLENITLSNALTTLSNYMFENCYSLTNVSIPNSVTSLGNGVFSNCYSLFGLSIPSSVTSIGQSAFSGCSSAGAYHFLSVIPPTLGTTAFSSIPSDCKIYVPAGGYIDYQTETNWSSYASYMVGE